ncbi:hypothetical protein BerOc1_01594 [Pseudodesulfovibrio hydrargyri]|uniref:Uncharacterized protein n=1 Tax=Pseudodesulfovibrio hydrargyri TaxID=2125990 RepID=A0A1J5MST7_9BACT|nr:hypothetical protein [Pseudodesulfovibrio hydrargyri]OIQ49669.1 hypothetical protein BerOc1_01594 [Pseudodesulfovibrio hydrargyri]
MGNQASTQVLQQGVDLFSDVTDFLGDRNSQKTAASNARDRAALIETDAAGAAHDTRRRAVQDAAGLRGERERVRSRGNAGWGGSGLAMSGSKALIRDAERLKDRQAEEDVLFKGEMNARSGLRSARSSANALRIDENVSPARSTLSMGSKIYGRN